MARNTKYSAAQEFFFEKLVARKQFLTETVKAKGSFNECEAGKEYLYSCEDV
jgi:hypothetical protein